MVSVQEHSIITCIHQCLTLVGHDAARAEAAAPLMRSQRSRSSFE